MQFKVQTTTTKETVQEIDPMEVTRVQYVSSKRCRVFRNDGASVDVNDAAIPVRAALRVELQNMVASLRRQLRERNEASLLNAKNNTKDHARIDELESQLDARNDEYGLLSDLVSATETAAPEAEQEYPNTVIRYKQVTEEGMSPFVNDTRAVAYLTPDGSPKPGWLYIPGEGCFVTSLNCQHLFAGGLAPKIIQLECRNRITGYIPSRDQYSEVRVLKVWDWKDFPECSNWTRIMKDLRPAWFDSPSEVFRFFASTTDAEKLVWRVGVGGAVMCRHATGREWFKSVHTTDSLLIQVRADHVIETDASSVRVLLGLSEKELRA